MRYPIKQWLKTTLVVSLNLLLLVLLVTVGTIVLFAFAHVIHETLKSWTAL